MSSFRWFAAIQILFSKDCNGSEVIAENTAAYALKVSNRLRIQPVNAAQNRPSNLWDLNFCKGRFVVTAAPSLYGGVKSGQPSELS
jgi:hypothetical protein